MIAKYVKLKVIVTLTVNVLYTFGQVFQISSISIVKIYADVR